MDCVFVVIFFLGVLEVTIGDPCTEFSPLPNLPRRQTSTVLKYNQRAICDRLLEDKWYKAKRSDMPTTAPQILTCGTFNPIWLADPLPQNDGAEHTLKACIRNFVSPCFRFINIKVKNCGKDNVYYLIGTTACDQAYCFNTRKVEDAPNITVSNAVAEYSGLKWNKQGGVYMPVLTYKCTFKGDRDKKYCYQVDWYVDGTIVFENQVVTTEFAEISDNKFNNTKVYKLNTLIQCYVAVKFCGKDEIGEFTVSKGYFIGIKVTTPVIKIERQGKGNVKFYPTVPFACGFQGGNRSIDCGTYIEMMNPPKLSHEDQITGSRRCNKKIVGYDSSKIKTFYNNGEWKKEYTMEVVHQSTTGFSPGNRRFRIRLESVGGAGHMAVWNTNVVLPDIIVDVYEKKKSDIWKGKMCSTRGDPHMRNFDGRRFDVHMKGVFIMYRNQEATQEVQIKTAVCARRGIAQYYCTCGVAVRVGQDVFVIDLCIRPKFANFINCGDDALTVYKKTEKRFEVIFPSGTTVKIDIWHNTKFMHVHIFPFVYDVKKTEGLCGNLDGSNDQVDMQLRNNPGVFDSRYPPNDFSNSWRPNSVENLFSYNNSVYENLKSLRSSQVRLCICDLNNRHRQKNDPKETSTITCRYEKYAMSNITSNKAFHCHVRVLAERKRRDLRNHIRRFKRQASDLEDTSLPVTLTKQEARLQCETAMNKSTMYTMCMDKVVDLDQSFLEECILDLQYTGQSDYINIALESALDSCKTITGKNVTLQRTSPEIAEEIMTSICPNNCSGNGDCYNGTCTCNEKFGGLDCSFDKYVAPIVDSLSDDGKCDRSDGTCEVITFYGNNFLEDTPTTCNIQRVEIDTSGNPSLNDSFTAPGEQISLFEANCPLDTVPNSFATKFKVSISNNGSVFTPEFDVHIYDSMCQEYDAIRDTYIFKDGFCFIQGKCYQNGQVNQKQMCLNCNIMDNGTFNWSLRSDFCLIDKQCYNEGEINPINTCDICNTHGKGASVWSENRNVCNISGVCFKNGDVNPKNKCQLCNITDSGKDKWSPDKSACIIDRKCYQNGNIANDNPCFACDTKRNKTAWSIRDGFCYIDGLCLMDGQNNPMKPCLICNASDKSSASWSHDTGFCFIDDTCYVNYQVDPDDICRICYVSNKEFKSNWSLSRACDNSYRDEETDTTTEMKITTETTDLPTTLDTDSPTTTLQSTVISPITKQQLTPTTESSTSTSSPTTEESTTEASSSSATPRIAKISSSTTSEATSTAKYQIKTTSHQNEISWTTSSSVKSFSTTYKTHTESAPSPETAEHTTSLVITIIVPIIVAVIVLVIIAIVAILVKRRRNETDGVTLKRLEMFHKGKMEAYCSPMSDKNKMENDKSETKDREMTNSETTAEVLMSGASADVTGSETMMPNEPTVND